MTTPSDTDRATKVLEIVTATAAPATLAAAVLYFFGWTRTNAVFRYFGVDPALLGFDAIDYLARSAGPAFAPAVTIVLTTAALYGLHHATLRGDTFLLRHPPTVAGRTYVVRIAPFLLAAGVVVVWCSTRVALGIPDVLGVAAALGLTSPMAAALGLGIGSVLVTMGVRLLRLTLHPTPRIPPVPLTARAIVVAAVLVAVFWATAIYSQQTGTTLAEFINRTPDAQADVTVHSGQPLHLLGDPPAGPDGYTYPGLHLLIYANDRWFLFTGERDLAGRLRVTVVRDTDDVSVTVGS